MRSNLPTGHMIVKNEDRFVWYAIASVIDNLSEFLIFDTGSTDNTVKIIKSFNSPKIIFNQKGNITAPQLASLRQEQIERTRTNWFWIIDGDEVYPKQTSREIIDYIRKESDQYEGGVVRRFDLLGDIYHYQSESVGEYNLFGQKGHLVLRLINKKRLKKIYVKGTYPYEAYYDSNHQLLTGHPTKNFFITKNRIFHSMYMKRSSLGTNLKSTLHRHKFKIEIGYKFPKDQKLPEVFFSNKPKIVPSVIDVRGPKYDFEAYILTPIKKLKRIFLG